MSQLVTNQRKAAGALFMASVSAILAVVVACFLGMNAVVLVLGGHALLQTIRWRVYRRLS